MKSVVLLQARLSASRLPGKVLLPLGPGAVLDWSRRRLSSIAPVLVCIPAATTDDELARYVGDGSVRGPEDDVLGRFALALAQAPEAEYVIRATADNPLVLPELIPPAIDLCARQQADYCSIEGSALGTTVEIIRRDAFDTLLDLATEPDEREHATLGLLRRPDRFRIARYEVPDTFRSDARLTLDTPADYAFLQQLIGDSVESPLVWTWPRIQARLAALPANTNPQHLYDHVQQLKERAWTPTSPSPVTP